MWQPNLTDCTLSIPNLLDDIDCKMKSMAGDLYNNTVFALNLPIKGEVWLDLINYKRILTYRQCNPDYASGFSTEKIASRIKLLQYK